jgi:hypothetical protein
MTMIWVETHESRERNESIGAESSARLQYVGFGTTDDDEAESALRAILPMEFRWIPLRSWSIRPLGGDCWEGSAEYSTKERPEPPDTGEVRFSCDTTGGTVHLTHSLATTAYAPVGSTAPDHYGAIGPGKNGEVKGVDITLPELKFSLSYRLPHADLTLAYVYTLFGLTGKVNDAAFKGFAAGELLFCGAQAEEGTNTDATVTFNFIASANAANIAIGSAITVTSKLGHQYLDVMYDEADDAAAKHFVSRPIAAYVHTVYDTADFSLLGIGVT